MKTTTTGPKIVSPQDGELGFLGSIGARFMIDGAETAQGFALVERFDLRIGEPLGGGWVPKR